MRRGGCGSRWGYRTSAERVQPHRHSPTSVCCLPRLVSCARLDPARDGRVRRPAHSAARAWDALVHHAERDLAHDARAAARRHSSGLRASAPPRAAGGNRAVPNGRLPRDRLARGRGRRAGGGDRCRRRHFRDRLRCHVGRCFRAPRRARSGADPAGDARDHDAGAADRRPRSPGRWSAWISRSVWGRSWRAW